MATLRLSLQDTSWLAAAASREWLLTDGLGGFAMGTVAGLRARRYHALLASREPGSMVRRARLLALDAVIEVQGRRFQLGTREWSDGSVVPDGHRNLIDFRIVEGVPRWRWQAEGTVIERVIAMEHGRPAVAIIHRVLESPAPVTLTLEAIVPADVDPVPLVDGFRESDLTVVGPPFEYKPSRWQGVLYREETLRGLDDCEDVQLLGRFRCQLGQGEQASVVAWVGAGTAPKPESVVEGAQTRCRDLVVLAHADNETDALLVHAADQFVVAGPDVMAGYPWFGTWSRDTLTAYEGLFLVTRRWSEGADLLERLGSTVSGGMLANTADWGSVEYNTVDAPMWYLYVVGRHCQVTGDWELGRRLLPALEAIVTGYARGTRFGIRMDSDGLVAQGEPGMALTWMDARVEGVAMTPRRGKPVEVNALWVAGLWHLADLQTRLGLDAQRVVELHGRAREAFRRRFPAPVGLHDVVDGPDGVDPSVRPNQLLAVSLRHGPFAGPDGLADQSFARHVLQACEALATPLGPRSLSPRHRDYAARFEGDMRQRDSVYHQGTVWPWLIGAYADAELAAGRRADAVLDGLVGHLGDGGLGSVSEVADGDTPQVLGGCPFQAWSVAELLRARRPLP